MSEKKVEASWSEALERLALSALVDEFDQQNYRAFGDKLSMPAFQLSDSLSQLGLWQPSPPTILLSRRLVFEQPWHVVVEVLRHEMAHQFVHEVLGVVEPSAHGPLFREICAQRGIDAAAAGLERPSSGADSSVLRKVTRLLALAQSAERFEAEAAAAAAQRLMLKHNIECIDRAAEREYCYTQLGKPSGRVQESQRSLAAILRKFFFVETLWIGVYDVAQGSRGTVLEVCGSRENVELAEYVHAFLNRSAENLWKQHQRAHGIRGNRDRRRFLAGVMAGFHAKLEAQRNEVQHEGLVWQGDALLSEYFRRRHPKTSRLSYATSSGSQAHGAGRRAGETLVLHRGISDGPSAGPRRLLGP